MLCSRWEIELDDVYVDGKLMPKSTIPGNGVSSNTVFALIDAVKAPVSS